MKFADYEIGLLALCCWREAAIDGSAGMRAVANVVRNRVNHKSFPDTFAGVICQKNQFSAMTFKGDLMTVKWPAATDGSFAQALDIAEDVYANPASPDSTGGALFYRNPATATSKWYEQNVAQNPQYRITATVGHHVFHGPAPVPDGYDPALWGEAPKYD